jgi:hypothetical protein
MEELRCFLSEDFLFVVMLAVEVDLGRKLSCKRVEGLILYTSDLRRSSVVSLRLLILNSRT